MRCTKIDFFELAGSTGVVVEFVVHDEEIERLFALIRQETIRIFYARVPAHFGVINPDAEDPVASPGGV
jgi:hypothetical protein